MLDLLAGLSLGYLLGGLPTAAIIARLRGESIFAVGSGNMGAMNTARNLGWGLGVLVATVDVGKGALAAYLGLQMAELASLAGPTALVPALAAAAGAVLGHAFSPWVHFAGGKAIATTFGASLPLFPMVGLYYLAIIVALYLIARNINFAGLLAGLTLPVVGFYLLAKEGWATEELFLAVTSLAPIGLVGVYKHATAWWRQRRAARAAAAPSANAVGSALDGNSQEHGE